MYSPWLLQRYSRPSYWRIVSRYVNQAILTTRHACGDGEA